MKRAVVLLSGGIDSTTTLALARREFAVHALSVAYGQRHQLELDGARRIAEAMGAVQHIVVPVNLRAIGGSALTADIDVPRDRSSEQIGSGEIPITYVPARNTVFLSLALGFAEVVEAFDIFIGANAIDYSGYPDCRPEYLEHFEKLANLATKAAVEGKGRYRIHAPLLKMTKAEILRTGTELGIDYSLTLSCYEPDELGRACGHCDSCQLRLKGFEEAGLTDPAPYQ
ncbi:MAG: 7-cyano-7-deazaguanine synthase QueC [Gemmataceae bacterium]